MATEYDPNERMPKANPTRWLPGVLMIGLAILIFFLVRTMRNTNAGGGGSTDSLRSESELLTPRTGDMPRVADDPEADTVATDTVGNRR